MSDPARAQTLKAEGNTLFGKSDWDAAHLKYTEAIGHDDQNAILYANRAACATRLGMFAEAKIDAQKAVKIDPKYAKGWGRLAAACTCLLQYKESAECWGKAIAALPTQNLTASELTQKGQYEYELKTAHERAAMAEEKYVVMPGAEYKGRMPWDRAEALKAELQAGMPDTAGSSAWVMLRAAELWDVGVEDMKQVKTLQTPMGVMYKGILGVVTKISDAVLTDSRIFRLDSPDWLELYNRQVNLEGSKSRAWPALSAQVVEEEALKRQQQEGWDAVRPAIELTVRAWILQGFVANRPNVDPKIALGHYDMALEVLDWGRTASWKDVPVPMKGVVFEDYFVRSVRQLRLESLRAVCGADPSQGPEAPLQRLYDEAKSLVNEMPEVGSPTLPPGEHDPGFVLAFGVYPKGSALTMVGYYHHHMARRCDKHKDHDAAADHIFKAHHAYYQAAKLFPKDDENHAWFLNVSVQMLQICGSPFDVALRVTEAVRLALPEMKKIWAHSAAAMQDRNAAFTLSLRLEEKIKKDLADGKIKLDDFMMPDYSMSS